MFMTSFELAFFSTPISITKSTFVFTQKYMIIVIYVRIIDEILKITHSLSVNRNLTVFRNSQSESFFKIVEFFEKVESFFEIVESFFEKFESFFEKLESCLVK